MASAWWGKQVKLLNTTGVKERPCVAITQSNLNTQTKIRENFFPHRNYLEIRSFKEWIHILYSVIDNNSVNKI